MYDFDTVRERRRTGSVKWDAGARIFGGDARFIPMWIADTDFPTLPEVVEAVRARLDHPLFGYPTEPPAFFSSLSGWMRRRHGWDVPTDWIVPADGVVPALAVALCALTAEGERVAVQTPCYDAFYRLIEQNRRVLAPNALIRDEQRFSIDLDGLERLFRDGVRSLLLCNPHNPTGRVWTADELRALGELCARWNARVFCDEIHADLALPGNRYTPFASVCPPGCVTVTCVSPAKAFNMMGLKAAAAIIPDPGARRDFRAYQERMGQLKLGVLSYEAAAAAWQHGDRYVDELRAYIDGNVRLVCESAPDLLPGIRCLRPEGTFLMLWDAASLGLRGRDVVSFFAREAGVALSGGASYGPALDGWVRVNLGCSRSLVARALEQVRDALVQQRKGAPQNAGVPSEA